MADRPDFLIETRSTYGAPQQKFITPTVLAGRTETILTIPGKGVIYGGFLQTTGAANRWLDYVELLIDGLALGGRSFKILNDYHIVNPADDILHLIHYNFTNRIYAVGFLPGLTFETSFGIRYTTVGAGSADIITPVIYALI